jgi:hypothetical protein
MKQQITGMLCTGYPARRCAPDAGLFTWPMRILPLHPNNHSGGARHGVRGIAFVVAPTGG